MSYYRAALSAARSGKLAAAARLAQCSLIIKEDASSAMHLCDLLRRNAAIETKTLNRLRALAEKHKYKKALRVRMPDNSKAHTIRGLLCAMLGWRFSARGEFALALAQNSENDLARRALLSLAGARAKVTKETSTSSGQVLK